ncbi:MAG: hypothetical protein AAF532_14540, partial [Planctomycetota bacterium]
RGATPRAAAFATLTPPHATTLILTHHTCLVEIQGSGFLSEPPNIGMTADALYAAVSENFIENDGSLPGVEIICPDVESLSLLYRTLRDHSAAGEGDAECWSVEDECQRLVRDYSNIAAEVASGRVNACHFVFDDLRVEEELIPGIGVFVWRDRIGLDWRMGPAWTVDEIFRFFVLLNRLVVLCVDNRLVSEEPEGPPDPAGFMNSWKAFSDQIR